MKTLKRIFLYSVLVILIFYVFLVDINVEGQLAIPVFAQERETIFEGFDTKLVSISDAMTDEKLGVIFADFGPIKPFSLIYRDKLNGLTWANREEAESVIQALVKGEEINLRYYEDEGNRYNQVDSKLQNIFLGFVYCKAANLFRWKDLGVSPDLPLVKLNFYAPTKPCIKSYARIDVQGNPDLMLINNKAEASAFNYSMGAWNASIMVGKEQVFGLSSDGEWICRGGCLNLFASILGKEHVIIRDSNGIMVLKEELKWTGKWPEGETVAKKAWEVAPLGSIDIEGDGKGKVLLYGFRELWQWGVDNHNFPLLGDDIQTGTETTISSDSSLKATETTKPLQDSLTEMVTWEKTYGGSDSDGASSLIQTTDGGYLVAGSTNSKGAGAKDAWLIKIDNQGSIIWDRTFGGSGKDYTSSLLQTTDGGYLVAGSTYSKGAGDLDVWIIKIDKEGNKIWEKTYGGSDSDGASSLIQTTDGGYLVAGSTNSKGSGEVDAWVIKLDREGNLLWDRTYGGNDFDNASSLIQTSDGGYAVAGHTYSKGSGGSDVWIFKLDSQGNLLWDRTYGETILDEANFLIQTTDGGFAIAGISWSSGGVFWFLKLDSQGNLLWDRTYGGNKLDDASSLIQTSDGGYAIAGRTNSKGAGAQDAWLIKLDSQGSIIWDRTFGGSDNDSAWSLIQTSDGGYALAGSTSSKGAGEFDAWVIKIDEQVSLVSGKEDSETEVSQASPTTHPLQGSLHCTDKAGYTCPSCLNKPGLFGGFNILTTQQDCYVKLIDQNGAYLGNQNDCEVTVKGEKWLGLEEESGTKLVEEINKGNFDFKRANKFIERTMNFPGDNYKYEFANNGKEFRLYLSRNREEAFKAVPWKNITVEIKNKETDKVFKYKFSRGIFPRAYSWSNGGVANYGQCVWWTAKRWVEEVDSKTLFPFYPIFPEAVNVKTIDSNYRPKKYDVLINYDPNNVSELGHYGFVEKVDGDKMYISQFNFIKPGEVYNYIIRTWNGKATNLFYSYNPSDKYYFKYYYRK